MLGSDSRTKGGSGSAWQPVRHPHRATASKLRWNLFLATTEALTRAAAMLHRVR